MRRFSVCCSNYSIEWTSSPKEEEEAARVAVAWRPVPAAPPVLLDWSQFSEVSTLQALTGVALTGMPRLPREAATATLLAAGER